MDELPYRDPSPPAPLDPYLAVWAMHRSRRSLRPSAVAGWVLGPLVVFFAIPWVVCLGFVYVSALPCRCGSGLRAQ